MKRYRPVFISVILLSTAFFTCVMGQAQDVMEEPAEINAFIKGEIPSININWTAITLTVEDAFGIDWDMLKSKIPEWYMRLVWPFNPSFPQPVERFLGHTGLRFEPEIVEGNPKGWYLRVTPSSISESNTGDTYDIELDARIDDTAVDYSVVVGIKCIRLDTLGGEIGYSYIYIPVKASPLNFIEMRAEETTKKAGLKSVIYFDVEITNIGYYKDVFQFNIREENGLVGLFNEQALVLEPGETRQVTIGVRTPEKFFDPGTPNKIDIYAFSSGDQTETHVGSLVVITEGFYVSPLIGIILIPILIILIVIFVFFFYFRTKREKELFGKPDKPWRIPVEKKYLEELKEKDKEEYDKVRQMMEEEYQSALLWYESYHTAMKQEPKEKHGKKQGFLRNLFKKSDKTTSKPPKEKPEPKEKQEKEIQQFEEIKKEKQREQVDHEAERKQREKEKALLKIQRQQEKQRRKLRT